MPHEITSYAIASIGPALLLLVGLSRQGPADPTGTTILGTGSSAVILRKLGSRRFRSVPGGWARVGALPALGSEAPAAEFHELAIISMPADEADFELDFSKVSPAHAKRPGNGLSLAAVIDEINRARNTAPKV